jgi:DNA repair photolyase
MAKYETGTREWSQHSFNCVKGCAHGCLYCYARGLRFNPKRGLDWEREELDDPQVPTKPGVIMFPTRHDFTAYTTQHCLAYLGWLLEKGNSVLVVTKSGLGTVSRIADVLRKHPRERSEIRFTLSHIIPSVGNFWEPHAPGLKDRLDGLGIAKALGIRTSVSCEPWLDSLENLVELVAAISPSVTETIWVGHANKLRQRTAWCRSPEVEAAIDIIEDRQRPMATRRVYEALRGNPKVRWKAEVAEVLRGQGTEVGDAR